MSTLSGPPVSVSELVAAVRREEGIASLPSAADEAVADNAGRVLVAAAHPGAGATTVAVAIAEALEKSGEREVTLVDAALAEVSGMLVAAEREVDSGIRGWRAGSRGRVRILRPTSSERAGAGVGDLPSTGGKRTVVDLAQPVGELDGLDAHSSLVIVLRATVPGVQRTEQALARLPNRPFIAVVGGYRWPREVSAALGPRLHAADERGRLVFFPPDRRLAVRGVDADPLPGAVIAAAARLVGRIWPDDPAPDSNPRWKGRRK